MGERKLNLGCGSDIRSGYINLDSTKLPGVDMVHDLRTTPLPFQKDSFEEVLCQDVLEHVPDYEKLLSEIHRIMAPGGKLIIRVPHYTSRNNHADPTHRRRFSIDTMDFFVENPDFSEAKKRSYYFPFHFERVVSARITLPHTSPLLFLNHPVEWLINKNRRMGRLYELSFLSGLFPGENLLVELRK